MVIWPFGLCILGELTGSALSGSGEEFLNIVLRPHDEALRNCYGIGAKEIAAGVQAIANSIRTGFLSAVERIERGIMAVHSHNGTEEVSREIATELSESVDDLLNGGICNLSRHTNLAFPLLDDLPIHRVRTPSSWQKENCEERIADATVFGEAWHQAWRRFLHHGRTIRS